jgi:hypothetical protein
MFICHTPFPAVCRVACDVFWLEKASVASFFSWQTRMKKGLGLLQALHSVEFLVVGADGVEPPTYAL